MNSQSIAPQELHAESEPASNVEFHVTYFDAECGRARLEIFATAVQAERFASLQCSGEDSWAVVDLVEAVEARIAA